MRTATQRDLARGASFRASWIGAALAAASFMCGTPSFGQTLTISSRSNDSALGNISARVLTEAFRRAGIGLTFKPLPLLRAIEEANDGETDGDWNRVDDVLAMYPNLIAVPTPINKHVIAVYGRTPEIRTMTRAQLSGLKFGHSRGFLMMNKFTQGMDVSIGGRLQEVFDMLANGRIDIAITEYVDAETQFVERHLTKKPPMWPYAWANEPMYLILNKRNASYVPRIDAALLQMKQEGLIDQFYDEAMRKLNIPKLVPEKNRVEPRFPLH